MLFRVLEIKKQTNRALLLGAASSEKLADYATMLAAQGQLQAALEILPEATADKVSSLYLFLPPSLFLRRSLIDTAGFK